MSFGTFRDERPEVDSAWLSEVMLGLGLMKDV